MEKFTILEFMQTVFDKKRTAERASEIGEAILAGRSLRMTDIANQMPGNTDAAYKRIQRFLEQEDACEVLGRLYQPTAEFMIGDPTEIERPAAWKTDYVGTLKDGKTKGFWNLVLATPYRGRAIPCGFVTYSSKTIANNQDSRNLNHFRAFENIKDLLGDKPLVLDREFSYVELLLNLIEEQVSFVIRLNLGSNPPAFYDQEGKRVALTISPGETVTLNKVWYKGKACVNLIGKWRKGLRQPLWVMTNLDAQQGLHIYFERMKIEQSFKDLKDLLGMTKLMYKKQEHMEKMIALLLIVFSIGLLVGENLRDFVYGQPIHENEVIPQEHVIPDNPQRKQSKKWKLYSGLFILLRQKLTLSNDQLEIIIQQTLTTFTALVHYPVRTPVRT
ncbi:MAG: transposase [Anaerolineales bacterium]|nr:transposase [Anaerolineales bacterium]